MRSSFTILLLLLLLPLGVTSAQDPGATSTSQHFLRLVGPEGRPLADVEVGVRKVTDSATVGRDDTPPQILRTDARGTLEVRAGSGVTLEVTTDGYLPHSVSPDDDASLTVALTPALTLRGRVVAVDGGALVGVDVEAQPEIRQTESMSESEEDPPTLRVQSDAEGRFLLYPVAPGTLYGLVANRPGLSRTTLKVAPVELGENLEELKIVLAPGVMGFGRVLDLEEHPIAGARVRLHPETGREAPWRTVPPDEDREATTDEEGRFELRDLSPDTYTLIAGASGYGELAVPGVEIVAAELSLDLGTVLLERGRHLVGRVNDPDGEPVAGAEVSWRRTAAVGGRSDGDDRPAVTDSDGRFTLDGLPSAAVLDVEVRHKDFQPRHLRGIRVGPEPLDVVLQPGVTLRGEVVDAAGQPAEGVVVELYGSSDEDRRGSTTVSDAEGHFALDGQPPGKVTLSVRSPLGFSPPRQLVLRAAESPFTIRLELRAGATVSGWILDPEGAGVAGGTVEVRCHSPGRIEPRPGGREPQGRADEEGRFSVSGLAEGSYRITASHPDFVPVTKLLEVGGEELYPLDLEFAERRDPEAARLVGRIVDSSGQGVQGADVALVPMAPRQREWTTSRSDGRFEVRATALGEHFVEVRHPRFASYRSDVIDFDGGPVPELLVELAEGGSIRGSIRGLGPEQLTRVKVVAFSQGPEQEGQVAYDGSYHLTGLAAGDWSVRAFVDSRSASGRATLGSAGGSVTLDLRFEPGFQLHGLARMDGAPMDGARVGARCHASFHGQVSTDEEGRFELRDVPSGNCTLTLTETSRGALAQRQVEVLGDTEVEIEVSSNALTGEVLNLYGYEPIAGATVELFLAGGVQPHSPLKVLTDSQGRFTIAAPEQGSFKVRVEKEGFAFSERQVDLDASRTLRLLLAPEEEVALYVVGPEGDVPALVEVEVFVGDSLLHSRSYQPELDGRVQLGSLPAGFWQVHVTGGGFLGKARLQVPGEAPVVVLGATD